MLLIEESLSVVVSLEIDSSCTVVVSVVSGIKARRVISRHSTAPTIRPYFLRLFGSFIAIAFLSQNFEIRIYATSKIA